jgi:adenylate cyclase
VSNSVAAPAVLHAAPSLTQGRLRLASGLVLMAFLTTHLLNHALGLVSLAAMQEGSRIFALLWRTPPGTLALYGAFFTHFGLVLAALYRRRTLRMPAREAWQVVLGLSIPFLLISHVVGTRVQDALGGEPIRYSTMVRNLWFVFPVNGARQSLSIVIAWLHGSLGVAFWLRSKPWYPAAQPWVLGLALLLPVLGWLGFVQAAREMALLDRAGIATVTQAPPSIAGLDDIRTGLQWAFGLAIAGLFAARAFRSWRQRENGLTVSYPGSRKVSVPSGLSVLEASRIAGLPHASACGGRGRCSTCRVRVTQGLDRLPPPTGQELATLARIKAGPDVRLACQLRPVSDVAVTPILPVGVARGLPGVTPARASRGRERDVAVLFCDLRGFTRLSERRLPFDTVYLLNRYFDMVGHAVDEAGGHLDKFIGDGALALFGLEVEAETAARQALAAAFAIKRGLQRMNTELDSELDQPLRIAVSLHLGAAVVGEMGYGQAVSLTAVGDTINVASRLEGLAKERNAELVVSEPVAIAAGLVLAAFADEEVPVRGRRDAVRVWVVPDIARLAESTPSVSS